MLGTSALLRGGSRLLILALASLVLTVLGCTGAQASTPTALPSVSPPAQVRPAAVHAVPDAVSLDAPQPDQPSCSPGRDTVRVEHNALVPTIALHQHPPAGSGAALPRRLPPDVAAERPSGRIPTALTHLDLGMVRT